MKKTKIVATIGPASEKKLTLIKMIRNGMNVARLNFSHGTYDNHKMLIKNLRAAEKEMRVKVGIMADIQGPRIRVANEKAFSIEKGERILVTDLHCKEKYGCKKSLILDWSGFYEHLVLGKVIFIEDGLIQLRVVEKKTAGVVAEVLAGEEIKPRKGVNIPAISHYLGFLTEKDLEDLEFILAQDIDLLAVSFVSNRKNLLSLREIIDHIVEKKLRGKAKERRQKSPLWIFSKIERATAIRNMDSLIEESDGILVARGDLAIEEPQEKVAVYQKDIIHKCLREQKPVIVATQMMASMAGNARPTRAEISDVTNAVVDNADAVMLSNETAVGRYPIEVVKTMKEVVVTAEKSPYNDVALDKRSKFGKLLVSYLLGPQAARETGVIEDSQANGRKRGRKRIVWAKTLDELRGLSSLRQEDVRLKLALRDIHEKRKASIIWGTE